MPEPRATVVITTKNRKEELRGAIESCLAQTILPEIIVIDDGSTDGTSEMIRENFPSVRLYREEQSKGYIIGRNRGAELANAPYIFSIDDDAAFVSPRTIEQTLGEFDHPRIGAVAIPHKDVNKPDKKVIVAPDERVQVIFTFTGCAHAVRRDLFLSLGGYRTYLFHFTEEIEFCERLLQHGYVVRVGRADEIHHYESPKRESSRPFIYLARNNLLSAWYFVPLRNLPEALARVFAGQLRYGLRHGHVTWSMLGLAKGVRGIFHEFGERNPMSRALFELHRGLATGGPRFLAEIEASLPPQPGLPSSVAAAGVIVPTTSQSSPAR